MMKKMRSRMKGVMRGKKRKRIIKKQYQSKQSMKTS